MPGNLQPEDRTAWLLLIGRRLRAEYDAVAEPVPERLAALIQQLETSTEPSGSPDAAHQDGSQQDGSQQDGEPGPFGDFPLRMARA
jgi:Anti-sigma factor NepR